MRFINSPTSYGAIFVTAGAVLWGLDGLFRRSLAKDLDAPTIVLTEHVFLVLVMLPFLGRAFRHARQQLHAREWAALMAVGAGASATATVLFTEAFGRGDPITPLVLQKLQPFIAIAGAYTVLGERYRGRYWIYFALGIIGAWLLAFREPGEVHVEDVQVAALSIGAATFWGLGTVFGRLLSFKLSFVELTTLRFALGLPASVALVFATNSKPTPPTDDLASLGLLALVPGLIALLFYYYGMRRTPASVATLAELAFPVTAAVVGYLFLQGRLTDTQWVGAGVLTATVFVLNFRSSRDAEDVGVEIDDDVLVDLVKERTPATSN